MTENPTPKPTPGPWKQFTDHFEKGWFIGNAFLEPVVKLETMMPIKSGLKAKNAAKLLTEKEKANAQLIVAACNACQAINPDNPIMVAHNIPELIDALKEYKYNLNDFGNGHLKTDLSLNHVFKSLSLILGTTVTMKGLNHDLV